jgi:ABC-type transport system substrate-binding protein
VRYTHWHCKNFFYITGYCNEAYDKLIDEARITLDVARRAELYGKAKAMIKHDAVALPLYHRNVTYAVRKNVKGFQADPYDFYQFYNVWMTRR